MAAREQRDQDLLDHLVLPDDHFPQLGEDSLAALGDFVGADRRRDVHVSPNV